MTFAKLFLVAALLLGMLFAAQVWAAEATNKDVGKFERNGSTHRLDVPNKPPVIVFGKDSEPWLETTLQSLGGKIVNTAIIANDSGERYLLVAWEFPDIIVRAPHVDFYSIYDVPAEKGYKSNRPYKVFELLRTVEAAEFGLAEILAFPGSHWARTSRPWRSSAFMWAEMYRKALGTNTLFWKATRKNLNLNGPAKSVNRKIWMGMGNWNSPSADGQN